MSGSIHRRLLFWSNHPHQHPSRTNEEHLTEHSLEHDGLTRTFLQHLPENYQAGNPMLIVLHGGEGTQSSNFHSGGLRPGSFAGRPWARLSNQHGFLLLSPGAVPVNGGLFGFFNGAWWNDGRQPATGQATSTADDVGFLAALIAWAVTERGVDPNRVYMAGGSNGGMMTYRMLLEVPDLIAAGAAFVANLPENVYQAATDASNTANTVVVPRPIFIMNGSKDTGMPFEGGMVIFDQGRVVSSAVTRDFFVERNEASLQETTNVMSSQGCLITSELYTSTTTPVVYKVMHDAGHVMARSERFGLLLELFYTIMFGHSCRTMSEEDGGALAWNFLSQYTL